MARCKALRNWLRDFSSLDERPPTDVKVWGEFMVYAYLFGVADEAIEQLRTTVPQVFEYDGSLGVTYMPWWFWYTSGNTLTGEALPSVGEMFESTLENSLSAAAEALSAASGGFSSGGGFAAGSPAAEAAASAEAEARDSAQAASRRCGGRAASEGARVAGCVRVAGQSGAAAAGMGGSQVAGCERVTGRGSTCIASGFRAAERVGCEWASGSKSAWDADCCGLKAGCGFWLRVAS